VDAWTDGLTRGGVSGGQLIGAAAGYRAADGMVWRYAREAAIGVI
jgi:hypothetical protein